MLKYIYIMLLFGLSACTVSTTLPAAITMTSTAQSVSVQSPVPTDNPVSQKQKILDEVVREATAFNQIVEQEKLLGNVEIRHDNDTRQDLFFFTGESDSKIRAAYENLEKQTNILYSEYLALYKQDYNPTPFPAFPTKDEALRFYYQALQQDQVWVDTQLKLEDALKVYNPDRGAYESLLNFEQSAWLDLRGKALEKLRMESELSPELLRKHEAIVEKIDGEPIEASEVTSLPFYRNDLVLFQYQTKKNYYVLDTDGVIIEITPIKIPLSAELTPSVPLNTGQLEEKARSLIQLFAPDANVNTLTPAFGSKTGSFFFRWEDRTKPLLDDGRSYPFIQVGLNGNGELLNYYNTLPLAR